MIKTKPSLYMGALAISVLIAFFSISNQAYAIPSIKEDSFNSSIKKFISENKGQRVIYKQNSMNCHMVKGKCQTKFFIGKLLDVNKTSVLMLSMGYFPVSSTEDVKNLMENPDAHMKKFPNEARVLYSINDLTIAEIVE